MRLGEIADALRADLDGDADVEIRRVRPLDKASEGDLTFLMDGRDPPRPEEVQASAVIVDRKAARDGFPAGTALLRVDYAYFTFARAIDILHPEPPPSFEGVDPEAHIHPSAELGDGVAIGPEVVVRAGARIGAGTILHPGVIVGDRAVIGENVILHPRVTIYAESVVGDRSIIHAGAVIGSDGFGFAPSPQGIAKIRHLGKAILGSDVEIGANSTIDRGVLEDTVIGNGTKIDNLVQVGHNVTMGQHCMVAGQSGFAGSCEIGNGVVIAGQVGLGGHLKVGDGAQIGAKSGVHADVPPGSKILGTPATDIRTARRAYAMLYRLPELRREIDRITGHLQGLIPDQE